MPYTISFVIRKRIQVDNLYELGKEKRPTDEIIWTGTPEDIDDWLDRVFKKNKRDTGIGVKLSEIEG